MQVVPSSDLGFLLIERPNQPMHVGGLIIATVPKNKRKTFAADTFAEILQHTEAQPPFNKRLVKKTGRWHWQEDEAFDVAAHLQRIALPAPGDMDTLTELVGKLHSSPLDRAKPLWEAYLIEGLPNNRIAIYAKMHHAMVDGVAAMRYMQKMCSTEAGDKTVPLWALPPRPRNNAKKMSLSLPQQLGNAISDTKKTIGSTRTVITEVLKSIRARSRDPDYVSVFQAPQSLLNKPVSGARRFVARSWPMARIAELSKQHDATVNDIVLAMCGSALRRYLSDLKALPKSPLVALVPVSLRRDDSEGGNQIALALANLATHQDSSADRLETVIKTMNNSKTRFSRMNQTETLAYVTTVMGVYGANTAIGLAPEMQAANLVISNVPGPKQQLYFNGAQIEDIYPMGIALDGNALNITLTSYAGQLEFGIVGCRRLLPNLERLTDYLEDGLAEIEQLGQQK